MACIGIFTFSVIWLTLVSCSQVRGRLEILEKHVAVEAKEQKTGRNGSEMEVHALNSNNRNEKVNFSEKLAPKSLESVPTKIPPLINIYAPEDDSNYIQHWAVYQTGTGTSKVYYGAKTTLVVYGFSLEVDRSISTGFWIANGVDGPRNQLNVIRAGWQVSPAVYGDSLTHFFISWTADGYNSTGCYNLNCKGFVLVNRTPIIPGGVLQPVSTPGGAQYEISIRVFKAGLTGDWWLQYGHGDNVTRIGYWPKSLFTSLAYAASRVDFGGHVSFQKNGVSPPMGSGYFPADSRAAYFKDTAYMDDDGGYFISKHPPAYVDSPRCYQLAKFSPDRFTYGGPGGCDN